MVQTDEIAPDVFRICLYVEQYDLQFNHFLVRDEQPLLFHAGMRWMFPDLRQAVAGLIDPSTLRWIGWSHFESDECGALNAWLKLAPAAQPLCTPIAAMVNMADYADRPAHAPGADEVLRTGRRRFRMIATPHLPHGWDAGLLFEETNRTLFCSDLLHQTGRQAPSTDSDDVLERTAEAIAAAQAGPLMDYLPYTPHTGRLLGELARLRPRLLATMHGASYAGDGRRILEGLEPILKEVFG